MIRDYRDLIAWQKSMDLVEAVYRITRAFPKEEVYALSSQLRRASVSIPSNIAEGHSRKATRVFIHFLSVAYGSLKEVETQILISLRLKYLSEKEFQTIMTLTTEIGRLLSGLRKSLGRKNTQWTTFPHNPLPSILNPLPSILCKTSLPNSSGAA